MPTPSDEELERLHAEIATLAEQASAVFDKVGLRDDEKAWAKQVSEQIAHFSITAWTALRHDEPRSKIRMLALSAAVASALAIVDGNARATDAFSNQDDLPE